MTGSSSAPPTEARTELDLRRRLALALLVPLYRLYNLTLRFRFHCSEETREILASEGAVILAYWHEHIATVPWLPFFGAQTWVAIIGWWEVIIGVTFLFEKTTRIAIGLLALQMVGTFMPLVVLPEVAFQMGKIPYGPTMEGQYIIKNLMIISAALVVGGTVRRKTS